MPLVMFPVPVVMLPMETLPVGVGRLGMYVSLRAKDIFSAICISYSKKVKSPKIIAGPLFGDPTVGHGQGSRLALSVIPSLSQPLRTDFQLVFKLIEFCHWLRMNSLTAQQFYFLFYLYDMCTHDEHVISPAPKGEPADLDPKLLAGLVQDVWDRFSNSTFILCNRQKNEREAIFCLQKMYWERKMGEIGKL